MFCSICCKVRCQLNLCVCLWQPHPVKRYHSNRRPSHSDLNCRHKSSVHKRPLLSGEKNRLANNEEYHPETQPSCHFPCMIVKRTFTSYISPPLACSVSKARERLNQNSSSTRVLMKKKNQRNGQPQNAKCSQCRPRARVYLMIPVVRSRISSSVHTFLFCNKRSSCIFISNKKSHYLY
jgi:hypothetical protein